MSKRQTKMVLLLRVLFDNSNKISNGTTILMKENKEPPIQNLFQLKRRKSKVTIDEDGWLSIQDKPVPYEIEMTRIKTAQDILAWVRHLSNKDWITVQDLNAFVEVCSEYREIRLSI